MILGMNGSRGSAAILMVAASILCFAQSLQATQPAKIELLPEPKLPETGPAQIQLVPEPLKKDPREAIKQYLPEERPIGQVTTVISTKEGGLPQNYAAAQFEGPEAFSIVRPWDATMYHWAPADYCHRPLYFEEVNFERYGYSHCYALQPAISAVKFVGSTVALPYQMTVHPRKECVYPLGHYRPGSPVPYQHHWPEWDPKAAAVEAGVITGLIFVVP